MRISIPAILAIGVLSASAVQAADLGEVTVTGPTISTPRFDATGTPVRQVSGTMTVQYNAISLTTNSGRALVDDKVADVARTLCSTISIAVDPASRDERTCVRQALDGAKSQLDAATTELRVRLAEEATLASAD